MFSHLILKSDIARFKFFCAWRMTSVRVHVKEQSEFQCIKFILKATNTLHYYSLLTLRCHLLHTRAHSCKSLYGDIRLRIYSSTSSGRSATVLSNLMKDPVGVCEFMSTWFKYLSLRFNLHHNPLHHHFSKHRNFWHLEENSTTKRLLLGQNVDHCRGILILCLVFP
jgi:hypothetical protein